MKNKFPDAVTPPKIVHSARKERDRHIIRSILIGVSIRLFIVIIEVIGVFLYGAASLLMDALASGVDILSSLIMLIFIKLAARPPDHNHPFGHGRFEPLAGLQSAIVLTCLGIGMTIQQLFFLDLTEKGEISSVVWFIPFTAVFLLEISYHIAMRVAKKYDSAALAADAIHYRIDSITSLIAMVALLCAAYIPAWSLFIDHLGAISIAVFMIGMGVTAIKGNLNQLLDHIPSKKFFNIVSLAAKRVQGVKETEKIRLQLYGPDAHVDIDIEVDPEMSVKKAHTISQKVRAEIQKDWPAVRDVTVHIEPFYEGDHA